MQAPVVPSGPHLAYWDSKDETLVNARGMQVRQTILAFQRMPYPHPCGGSLWPPWSAQHGISAVALDVLTAG